MVNGKIRSNLACFAMNTLTFNTRYAVVAHDAGGAEILSSLIRRRRLNVILALAGPAVAVFARKLPELVNCELDYAISKADGVLCSTSFPGDWEIRALFMARDAGKPTCAVLDHWTNYCERFQGMTGLILPDKILTVDGKAFAKATLLFPQVQVVQIENPFEADCIDDIIAEEARLTEIERGNRNSTVLYVTQPTSEHAFRQFGNKAHWGYTETEALCYFLDRCCNTFPELRRVVVRPHPAEMIEKYTSISNPNLDVVIRSVHSLPKEISMSTCVAGCNTMAMVVAGWAGKRVVCTIPPGGRGFDLPMDSAIWLRDL